MNKKILLTSLTLLPLTTLVVACSNKIEEAKPYMKNGKVFIDKDKLAVALERPGVSLKDGSFNQQIAEAVKEIKNLDSIDSIKASKPAKLGLDAQKQMFDNIPKGSTIITSGYGLSVALKEMKEEINEKNIIYIDGSLDGKPNVAAVEFETSKVSFLAGYSLVKKFSDSLENDNKKEIFKKYAGKDDVITISTFGAINITPIQHFMWGFKSGIEYGIKELKTVSNKLNEKIKFLKFDTESEHFSGNFESGGGESISLKLINKSVDIIFPVAGIQTEDLLKAIKTKETFQKTYIVGVDSKQEIKYQKNEAILFSILKDVKKAVLDIFAKTNGKKVHDSIKGFGKTTIGNLANSLVNISDGKDEKGAQIPNTLNIKEIYEKSKKDAKITQYLTDKEKDIIKSGI